MIYGAPILMPMTNVRSDVVVTYICTIGIYILLDDAVEPHNHPAPPANSRAVTFLTTATALATTAEPSTSFLFLSAVAVLLDRG